MTKLLQENAWFREVFDDYYEYVRNYLYYLSGDIELSEDLVQDVFMKLWEKQKSVKRDSIKPFLFTIARNLYFNTYKRKQIDLRFMNSLVIQSDTDSPESLLEQKEFDQKLQNALSNLPEKCRTYYLMSRIDEMKYAEIAEAFDISIKAVEKQISKAMRLLEEQLGHKI